MLFASFLQGGTPQAAHLTWINIGIGLLFLLLDALLSVTLQLGLSTSLLTAAARCVIQLTLMGFVLQKVFETDNPWAVAGITCLLILLGTTEVVYNKSKRRFAHMYPSVLLSMSCSVLPVTVLGTKFVIGYSPFWTPEAFIPVLGMLCGNCISAIVVSTTSVLRDVKDNRDRVEMYLAFGGSRWEASKPIAVDALRLALTPSLNQMSVIGLISIPGMMTGAILGGSSVEQAARLQMVIMFLIAATTALSAIVATLLACSIIIDGELRIREDKIKDSPTVLNRFSGAIAGLKGLRWTWRPSQSHRVQP